MRRLRISAISYLNTAPLMWDFEHGEAGREPRGQTVISFYADPSIDPQEQEKIIAATTVLDIAPERATKNARRA